MSTSTLELGTGALATVQVARRPILAAAAGHTLLGYQLLFSDTGGLFSAFADVDEFRATTEVLSHSVLTLGVGNVVGPAMAFVRFPRAQIVDAAPLILPPDQSAVELGPDSWASRDGAVLEHCQHLKELGYGLVLSDYRPLAVAEPMLALADYVKVDLTSRTPADASGLVAALQAAGVQVIAIGVDEDADRAHAVAAGADYLEGFFFSRPAVVEGRELPGFKLAYLQLLRKAYAVDVDFPELASIIKSDVALSYKLLRFVNSAHFGLRGRIESIEKALVMLGVDNVRRWVSVATVSGLSESRPQELAVLCATRARFCESLGRKLDVATPHDCFSLGMFSLLDVMLGTTMQQALADVPIDQSVAGALSGEPGQLADLLDVVIAYERGKWDVVSHVARDHEWPETELIGLYIDAIEWSRDFFGPGAST